MNSKSNFICHWLLPDGTEGSSGVFPDKASSLAANNLSLGAGCRGIIDLDCCRVDAQNSIDKMGDAIALVGTACQMKSWLKKAPPRRSVWQFALLPETSPRIVLPLANARALRQGLSLHRPGRIRARVGVFFLRCFAGLTPLRRLFRKRLVIMFGEHDRDPHGLLLSGLEASLIRNGKVALYLGTAGPDRKTVVLPLGGGRPTFIVKLGETTRAVAALRREADSLIQLADSSVCALVPKLIKEHQVGSDALALHIEYRERCWSTARRTRKEAQEFLSAIASLDRRYIALRDWLDSHAPEKGSDCRSLANLRAALEVKAAKGFQLITHRIHGDFAPWNCSITRQGFFVYDWEDSKPSGLALCDAFHYVIAPALLIRRLRMPKREFKAAMEMASPVGLSLGMAQEAITIHFAAWLLIWHPHRTDPGLFTLRQLAAERLT